MFRRKTDAVRLKMSRSSESNWRRFNIDADKRGRMRETAISHRLFFLFPFSLVSPPARVGVAAFGMHLVTGNAGRPSFFVPVCFCPKLLIHCRKKKKSYVREA